MKEIERGQILIIVVLVMTIALTVGLSVATRTITNLRTTSEQESSEKAFAAAEAGIEQALQNNIATSGAFVDTNTSYQTTMNTLAGKEFLLQNGTTILQDTPVDVWFSLAPDFTSLFPNGKVTLYWGDPADSDCSSAALEAVVISGTKANPSLTTYAFDVCDNRITENSFTKVNASGGTILNKQFKYKKEITINSGLLMRIIPLYAKTKMAITGCDATGGNCIDLPVQGTVITSVGQSETTQRKIVGVRENPVLPIEMFPYMIFSPK